MTRDEFITKIENGSDIMFDVSGKHFTILTWCENGIGIDEQHPNEKGMQYFHTAEELLEKFPVDGVPPGISSAIISLRRGCICCREGIAGYGVRIAGIPKCR